MSSLSRTLASTALAFALAAPAAAGQQSSASHKVVPSQPTPVGWSFTPALGASQAWDNDVLLRGSAATGSDDFVSVANPRGDLNFNGTHTQFSARYDGSLLFYRRLSTLDSYDQHGSASLRQQVSPRNTLFLEGSGAIAPTTELLELTGVPFVRVGARTDQVRAGFETLLSKHTTLTAAARFEQVQFDPTQTSNAFLLSGDTIGAAVTVRKDVSLQTTVTGNYDGQRADMGSTHAIFFVHNIAIGMERRLTSRLLISAAGGVSTLTASALAPAHVGPNWRVGGVRDFRTSSLEMFFAQSYVASWGLGGTTRHQELSTRFGIPLTPRVYTTSVVSWRRDRQLVAGTIPFRSLWLEGALGYSMARWVRMEAFFAGTRQTYQTNSSLVHNRFGIQVIASKPLRIR